MEQSYRRARVRAHVDQWVAVWAVVGVVSWENYPAMLRDAARWHEQARGLALLLDFREAQVSLSVDAWVELAAPVVRPPAAIAVPGVIVSRPEQWGYFIDYAVALCERGVSRVAQTDLERARQLAARFAASQLREALSVSRRGTPPRPRGAQRPAAGPADRQFAGQTPVSECR